ncbi:MAG: RNA-binding protein [Candidatus Riflebacteria bacterium]|nr:RNA-binding protein [Candidatus Riflebacteria bacterium]
MSSKIFVGNLPFSVDNRKLEEEFTKFGQIVSAKVIMDRNSGRSRGYGFVEFTDAGSAQAAVDGMNDQPMEGRKLTVSLAKNQV